MYLNIKLKSIKINYKIINLIKSNRIHSFQFSPSSVVSFIHSFILGLMGLTWRWYPRLMAVCLSADALLRVL